MKKIITIGASGIFLLSLGYSNITVGTTGDYAPFSTFDNNINKYKGKDIDLIQKYAEATDQRVRFIKTTWKTAESDLKAHKFDIYAGGMSITNARKENFTFSTKLISFHKAAITQCLKLNKFKTFSDIDNPNILVVENRGGTNEKIALKKLRNAKLLIIKDNKSAIKSLTNGIDKIYPDLMFTDTTEINYLHAINPKLCIIPINFDKNISYQAFMFNKDNQGIALKKSFDSWLIKNPELLHKYRTS